MSDDREKGEWSIPVLSKDPVEEDDKSKHDGSNDKPLANGKDDKKDDAEVNDMVSFIMPSLERDQADE
jgi:hypothetical protein